MPPSATQIQQMPTEADQSEGISSQTETKKEQWCGESVFNNRSGQNESNMDMVLCITCTVVRTMMEALCKFEYNFNPNEAFTYNRYIYYDHH